MRMNRTFPRVIRPVFVAFALGLTAGTGGVPVALAQSQIQALPDLAQILRLGELMPIMRDEAVAQAAKEPPLDEAGAGRRWAEIAGRIHAPERLGQLFRDGFARAQAAQAPGTMAAAAAFYDTPLGRKLIGLELSARRAFLAPGAEEAATAARDAADGSPRLEAIRRLIAGADLIDPNVQGALNASLAFSQGFAQGGGFEGPVDEQTLLAMTAAREDELRTDTTDWLECYLLFAYGPLSDAELAEYTRFSASPAGKALAAALFAGFDAMFERTAHDMGLAAAGQVRGTAL